MFKSLDALQVDSEGNVRYDAIAHEGQRHGKLVQSQFKDLVPLAHRKDVSDEAHAMERPSDDKLRACLQLMLVLDGVFIFQMCGCILIN